MINKSLSQKGSAHVVIIVVLVVTLLVVLGFVFWQNFIMKDSSDNKTEVIKSDNQVNVVEKPIDKYANWKSGTFKNADISYKLPPNWQDISDNTQFQDKYTYEEVKIKSSDGFTLTMSVHNVGRGSEYMPEMPKVLEFKNIDDNYQWIITDDANGKVSHIFVGSGVTSIGESTQGVEFIQRDGMTIQLAGGYDSTAKLDSLSLFNEKEAVKEAKLVFESLKFN